MTYFGPIKNALITFPFLAALITIPYILYHYHKYGSVSFLRVVISYSFVLYLICAYYLVILPLPTMQKLAQMPVINPQLIPFNAVKDIITSANINFNDLSTLQNLFKSSALFQVLFNFLLTVPFGIYLRYYFKCNLKKTITLSLLLSLFFELTQVTGLYFIYPRPYRLFDVDDLIINTTGGIIGYLITPLFQLFLPTREELELKSYKKAKNVSFLRRLVSLTLDMMLITIIVIIISIFKNNIKHLFLIVSLCYFILLPIIFNGKTPGKKFVNIKISTLTGEKPKLYQLIIRYVMLFVVLLPSPFYIIYCALFINANLIPVKNDEFVILLVYLFVIGLILIECLIIFIHNVIMGKLFLYETLSKTKNISTVEIPDTLKDDDEINIEEKIIENEKNVEVKENKKIKKTKQTKKKKKN